VIAGGLARAGR